jgi:hypothetical protein
MIAFVLWICRRFIRRCKQGGLQFVILKPILVAVTFVLYSKQKYEDGNFSAKQGYLYVTIIYTISYSLALYALVLFYVACKDLLRPFKPVPKFIIIKSVVFLTYWQVRFILLDLCKCMMRIFFIILNLDLCFKIAGSACIFGCKIRINRKF